MDIWLSDRELKGLDFTGKPYSKSYAVKMTSGAQYTLISSRGNEDISQDAFIPYSLIDKKINNALVSVEGLGDVLIYQNEYIQCLDVLKANGISIDQLIEVERMVMTREQLATLTSGKTNVQKLMTSTKKSSGDKNYLLWGLLGLLALTTLAFIV